ncbi:helix-turn-helix domain-containing protein [Streptosporangium sp. NPDC048047]|uniref:helix-turn-helix domain-containing protein n=1 Tax=Streptosporangium sp. NPDC048047 TaxID=3155748 RepID=UPI0034358E9A
MTPAYTLRPDDLPARDRFDAWWEAEVERLLVRRMPGRAGAGALLAGLLWDLASHDPGVDARVATAALDLLAALLTQELGADRPPADDSRASMVARVQAFIERRLADPGLSPALVAAEHHVSVRHLQKLFEEQGLSVAGWIRRRRLERCRRDLSDPARSDLPVRAVAARWGFTSESHFNRAFHAAYGTPPATYRRRLRESGGTASTPRPADETARTRRRTVDGAA